MNNPSRYDHRRLFPGTSWEQSRWTREDWMGIGYSAAAITGLVLLIWGIITIGR